VIRDVLKDLMARECEVLQAATAEQALELLRQGPVDVLVTDKNMPGLSGLELAAQARKQWPGLRVMLMTGYPSVETARQALELGARDYLLKPFDDIRQVRARLRELLNASPEPAPAPESDSRRVYVLDEHPESSRQLAEALELLGLEPQVLAAPPAEPGPKPAAVVVSWDLGSAHGRSAMEAGQELARGAPMLVVIEHLSLETALEVLRVGAVTCMARPLPELPALARELARVLKLRAA
jgi:DNA-binding NtrC family response regulator